MKKKRGRETALDMLRSLAVVFLVVLPLWFFGQASPSDSKRIRAVDAGPALAAFALDQHAPVPTTPPGWVVNVARADPGMVRIGYVITEGSDEHYLEFAGGSGSTFLEAQTGKAKDEGAIDIGGVVWRDYRSAGGQQSLVRTTGSVSVVVGGVREDASQAQLVMLAASVR